jgi:putative spermidine/putrescine transport system ATP-binding protein
MLELSPTMNLEAATTARAALSIDLARICKTYGRFKALDEVAISIGSGEFLTLLGPSGSGKTTLLMIIAGFVRADSGSLRFGPNEMIHTPAHRRGVGMVFQNYALFPHMTVAENVAYPLRVRKVAKADTARRVNEVLQLVQLKGLGERKPSELSGGQRQRVALARSIVFEPQVLLMDEPLSALDKNLREAMQLEIRRLHDRLGVTTVYVTHDQREALTMSDRIVVMSNGQVEQIGTPKQIYNEPTTPFVGTFVGESYLLPVQMRGSTPHVLNQPLLAARHPAYTSDTTYQLLIRPERLCLQHQDSPTSNVLACVLEGVVYQGDSALVTMKTSIGTDIGMRLPARDPWLARVPASGSPLVVTLAVEDAIIVGADAR